MNVSAVSQDRDHQGPPSITDADRSYVYAVARRIVRDEDAAADVTQEALLLAFRNRDSFRGDAHYRTWLHRIATSAALTHLRKRRRRRDDCSVPLTVVPELPATSVRADDRLATCEAAARAHAELDGMDARYGDVLRLRFVEDRSEAEVARMLGLSLATVKIRTHRGRHALRAALSHAA